MTGHARGVERVVHVHDAALHKARAELLAVAELIDTKKIGRPEVARQLHRVGHRLQIAMAAQAHEHKVELAALPPGGLRCVESECSLKGGHRDSLARALAADDPQRFRVEVQRRAQTLVPGLARGRDRGGIGRKLQTTVGGLRPNGSECSGGDDPGNWKKAQTVHRQNLQIRTTLICDYA